MLSGYYSDVPLPLAKPNQIQRLNAKSAKKKFGKVREIKSTVRGKNIIPEDHLVICKINEDVNHGVFTLKPIKKGDCLEYTGQLRVRSSLAEQRYSIAVAELSFDNQEFHALAEKVAAEEKTTLDIQYGSQVLELDASEEGNIARFMQHLPDDKEISCLEFTKGDPCDIAQANMEIKVAATQDKAGQINGAKVFLVANRDINANEQLGWCYGLPYWFGQKRDPALFSLKTGEIVPRGHYEYRVIGLNAISTIRAQDAFFAYAPKESLMQSMQKPAIAFQGEGFTLMASTAGIKKALAHNPLLINVYADPIAVTLKGKCWKAIKTQEKVFTLSRHETGLFSANKKLIQAKYQKIGVDSKVEDDEKGYSIVLDKIDEAAFDKLLRL